MRYFKEDKVSLVLSTRSAECPFNKVFMVDAVILDWHRGSNVVCSVGLGVAPPQYTIIIISGITSRSLFCHKLKSFAVFWGYLRN